MRTLALVAVIVACACARGSQPEGGSARNPATRPAPEESAPAPASDFVVAPANSDSAPAGATSPPAVRATAGKLEVLGTMSAPNPCQDVKATVKREEGRVTATISATGRSGMCAQVIATFAYRLSETLPAGTYALTVTHTYPGTGWPNEKAVDTQVTIP